MLWRINTGINRKNHPVREKKPSLILIRRLLTKAMTGSPLIHPALQKKLQLQKRPKRTKAPDQPQKNPKRKKRPDLRKKNLKRTKIPDRQLKNPKRTKIPDQQLKSLKRTKNPDQTQKSLKKGKQMNRGNRMKTTLPPAILTKTPLTKTPLKRPMTLRPVTPVRTFLIKTPMMTLLIQPVPGMKKGKRIPERIQNAERTRKTVL